MSANRIIKKIDLINQLIEEGFIIDSKLKKGEITTEEYRKLNNELIENYNCERNKLLNNES